MIYYYNNKWQGGLEPLLPEEYPGDILAKKKKEDAIKANTAAKKKNEIYNAILNTASGTQAGTYLIQKAKITGLKDQAKEAGFTDEEIKSLFESYDNFYKTEKIGAGWNSDLGLKPPSGNFDAKYYLAENPELQAQWDAAVKSGDLDILEQYKNPAAFALYNYSYSGKASGKRGNKAEELSEVKAYLEKKPTDADIQALKDKQLGFAQEGLPKDTGVTGLQEAVSTYLGKKFTGETAQFGGLAQNILKDTITEMQKAKAKEQFLSTLGNMAGFQEIMDINKTLSSSLFGDTGFGGVLAFSGSEGAKAQESLEKSLQNMSGVNTSTIYNWQQWFDNSLKKQYQGDLELGLTKEEAEEKIKVEADFAKSFMDNYLIPLFNQSQSMSEFVSQLALKTEEQNPLQTQTITNAANNIAQLKSQTYLDQLKQLQDAYFDPNFYFNPVGNLKSDQAKELASSVDQAQKYAVQTETVAKDWEEAKKQVAAQSGYWYEQAYKYGVDVSNKDAFAKLHFQVQGQAKGFDGAEDLWTPSKVQDYIYAEILPAINTETEKLTAFGPLFNADEFASTVLAKAGVDPNDKATWGTVLTQFKMPNFTGSYEDLKSYVANTFKTVAAIEIEDKLAELKKKGIKPTQKELGAYYIEKPTDTATVPEGETALYKTFKSAGYGGNEEEFYKTFFPDLDIEEQKVLTKVASPADKLQFIEFDTTDPLKAFGTIETLMGGDTDFSNIFKLPSTEEGETPAKSYFNLGLEEEEPIYKPKTGAAILDEFTSLIKGF